MHSLPALTLSQLNIRKFIAIALGATTVTLMLFVGMQKLIENNQLSPTVTIDRPVITLIHEIEDKPLIERPRIKPKPIPLPQPESVTKIAQSDPDTGFDPSALVSNIGTPVITHKLNPHFARQGGDARPIVRVEPKYPSDAARDGVEGWVKLRFSITASGTVDNIQVIDAQPKRTFNQAARRALAKWKYKPNLQAGKPQAQDGMMVMLDFKLAS